MTHVATVTHVASRACFAQQQAARQAVSGIVTLLITGFGWAPRGQAGFVCPSWESRRMWPF